MIDRLLNIEATIQRRGASSTDTHGNPTTATSSSTTTRCYLEQKQAQQTEVTGAQATSRAQYLCIFAAGTSIDQTDRVVIGSTTYEVWGIPWQAYDARSGAVHHVECTLVEVQG